MRRKKILSCRYKVGSGSKTGPGSGPIFFYSDPRIRIRIKIKWIWNSDFNTVLKYINSLFLGNKTILSTTNFANKFLEGWIFKTKSWFYTNHFALLRLQTNVVKKLSVICVIFLYILELYIYLYIVRFLEIYSVIVIK